MSAWGATVHAYLFDSTDNGKTDYDSLAFSRDKKQLLATLQDGERSDWLPVTLQWRIPGRALGKDVETFFRAKVIKLEADGFFRVRFFFNNINKHLTDPDYIAGDLVENVGPMVDFVDNFPPQLIYYPEDKAAFLEEAGASLDWHRDATSFILGEYKPDILISDVYTPNQMLTSRWWMGYVDPASARYGEVSEEARTDLWKDVKWLYKKLDDIAGRLLEAADENTIVVLTSDHGAVPLDAWVRLNNLLAREGLLEFTIDADTGEPTIDWKKTKAIYLKMDSIYINPAGLAGDWTRGSGPDYESLRARVKKLLLELKDANGVRPVERVVGWEEAENTFRLLEERVGDLVLANRPGYGWSEEMTENLEIFSTPLKTGYKQAIISNDVKGMWAPFIIMGPGAKKGHDLGKQPIEMADQYPTIMKLLGLKTPDFVQGKVVNAVMETP